MPKLLVLLLGLGLLGCGQKAALDPDLRRFTAEKRKEIRQIAAINGTGVPGVVSRFYDCVEKNDWAGATSLYARMKDSLWVDQGPPRPPAGFVQEVLRTVNWDASLATALRSELWPVITETHNAFQVFHTWDENGCDGSATTS